MRSPFKRLRKAAEAAVEVFDPAPFLVRGELVICPVCKGDEFLRSSGGILHRPLFMTLRAPWLKIDRETTTLICTHCVHILHFGQPPERVGVDPQGTRGNPKVPRQSESGRHE